MGDTSAFFIDPATGRARELTEDHRLTNPRERQRLQDMGIQVGGCTAAAHRSCLAAGLTCMYRRTCPEQPRHSAHPLGRTLCAAAAGQQRAAAVWPQPVPRPGGQVPEGRGPGCVLRSGVVANWHLLTVMLTLNLCCGLGDNLLKDVGLARRVRGIPSGDVPGVPAPIGWNSPNAAHLHLQACLRSRTSATWCGWGSRRAASCSLPPTVSVLGGCVEQKSCAGSAAMSCDHLSKYSWPCRPCPPCLLCLLIRPCPSCLLCLLILSPACPVGGAGLWDVADPEAVAQAICQADRCACRCCDAAWLMALCCGGCADPQVCCRPADAANTPAVSSQLPLP